MPDKMASEGQLQSRTSISRLLLFVVVLSWCLFHGVEGSCELPDDLRGEWIDSTKGTLTFTNDTIIGYDIYLFGSFNLSCYTINNTYYILESTSFTFFSLTFQGYFCWSLTKVTDDLYYFYEHGSPLAGAGNEKVRMYLPFSTRDINDICSVSSPEPQSYRVLYRNNTLNSSPSACPSELQRYFTYNISVGGNSVCSSDMTLDVCTSTSTFKSGNVSTCNTSLGYSSSEEVVCLFYIQSGTMIYLTVANNDATVDNNSTYAYTCMVIDTSSSPYVATQYPEQCPDGINSTYVTSPGSSILMTVTGTCPVEVTGVATTSSSNMLWIIGVVLGILLLIFLIAYLLYRRQKKKEEERRKKEEEERLREEGRFTDGRDTEIADTISARGDSGPTITIAITGEETDDEDNKEGEPGFKPLEEDDTDFLGEKPGSQASGDITPTGTDPAYDSPRRRFRKRRRVWLIGKDGKAVKVWKEQEGKDPNDSGMEDDEESGYKLDGKYFGGKLNKKKEKDFFKQYGRKEVKKPNELTDKGELKENSGKLLKKIKKMAIVKSFTKKKRGKGTATKTADAYKHTEGPSTTEHTGDSSEGSYNSDENNDLVPRETDRNQLQQLSEHQEKDEDKLKISGDKSSADSGTGRDSALSSAGSSSSHIDRGDSGHGATSSGHDASSESEGKSSAGKGDSEGHSGRHSDDKSGHTSRKSVHSKKSGEEIEDAYSDDFEEEDEEEDGKGDESRPRGKSGVSGREEGPGREGAGPSRDDRGGSEVWTNSDEIGSGGKRYETEDGTGSEGSESAGKGAGREDGEETGGKSTTGGDRIGSGGTRGGESEKESAGSGKGIGTGGYSGAGSTDRPESAGGSSIGRSGTGAAGRPKSAGGSGIGQSGAGGIDRPKSADGSSFGQSGAGVLGRPKSAGGSSIGQSGAGGLGRPKSAGGSSIGQSGAGGLGRPKSAGGSSIGQSGAGGLGRPKSAGGSSIRQSRAGSTDRIKSAGGSSIVDEDGKAGGDEADKGRGRRTGEGGPGREDGTGEGRGEAGDEGAGDGDKGRDTGAIAGGTGGVTGRSDGGDDSSGPDGVSSRGKESRAGTDVSKGGRDSIGPDGICSRGKDSRPSTDVSKGGRDSSGPDGVSSRGKDSRPSTDVSKGGRDSSGPDGVSSRVKDSRPSTDVSKSGRDSSGPDGVSSRGKDSRTSTDISKSGRDSFGPDCVSSRGKESRAGTDISKGGGDNTKDRSHCDEVLDDDLDVLDSGELESRTTGDDKGGKHTGKGSSRTRSAGKGKGGKGTAWTGQGKTGGTRREADSSAGESSGAGDRDVSRRGLSTSTADTPSPNKQIGSRTSLGTSVSFQLNSESSGPRASKRGGVSMFSSLASTRDDVTLPSMSSGFIESDDGGPTFRDSSSWDRSREGSSDKRGDQSVTIIPGSSKDSSSQVAGTSKQTIQVTPRDPKQRRLAQEEESIARGTAASKNKWTGLHGRDTREESTITSIDLNDSFLHTPLMPMESSRPPTNHRRRGWQDGETPGSPERSRSRMERSQSERVTESRSVHWQGDDDFSVPGTTDAGRRSVRWKPESTLGSMSVDSHAVSITPGFGRHRYPDSEAPSTSSRDNWVYSSMSRLALLHRRRREVAPRADEAVMYDEHGRRIQRFSTEGSGWGRLLEELYPDKKYLDYAKASSRGRPDEEEYLHGKAREGLKYLYGRYRYWKGQPPLVRPGTQLSVRSFDSKTTASGPVRGTTAPTPASQGKEEL